MPNQRKPVAFLATAQPEKARAFYGGILGLPLRAQTPFALVFDDLVCALRIQIVPGFAPAPHTVHGWDVQSIDQDIAELRGNGVTFEMFGSLEQSHTGIWTSPDGHKIAWFKDPCGNILSLTEHTYP